MSLNQEVASAEARAWWGSFKKPFHYHRLLVRAETRVNDALWVKELTFSVQNSKSKCSDPNFPSQVTL